MIEIEIDRKRLNYNENLKFMPFGKSFHFYAIWELCHLGSYRFDIYFKTKEKFTSSVKFLAPVPNKQETVFVISVN